MATSNHKETPAKPTSKSSLPQEIRFGCESSVRLLAFPMNQDPSGMFDDILKRNETVIRRNAVLLQFRFSDTHVWRHPVTHVGGFTRLRLVFVAWALYNRLHGMNLEKQQQPFGPVPPLKDVALNGFRLVSDDTKLCVYEMF
jgi:hypothetical protein